MVVALRLCVSVASRLQDLALACSGSWDNASVLGRCCNMREQTSILSSAPRVDPGNANTSVQPIKPARTRQHRVRHTLLTVRSSPRRFRGSSGRIGCKGFRVTSRGDNPVPPVAPRSCSSVAKRFTSLWIDATSSGMMIASHPESQAAPADEVQPYRLRPLSGRRAESGTNNDATEVNDFR